MASVYSTVTGKKFNELYKDTKFYKITNESECHFNFQYKDGLNEDFIKFNPSDECKPGGLYFTELNKIGYYLEYGCNIREVKILDDSLIYIENNKFKTNKFYLEKKILLKDFEYWNDINFCKIIEKQTYEFFKYINPKFQTKELCELAIEQTWCALQYVRSDLQTKELCELAIEQTWRALQYVRSDLQTKELCEFAIEQDWSALEYVRSKLQTEELYKLAIKQDGRALQFIAPCNQTQKICDIAVHNNKLASKYSIYHKTNYNSIGILFGFVIGVVIINVMQKN
jgi:hypothetical protein